MKTGQFKKFRMIEEANKKLLGVSDLREAIRKRREGRSASGK